MFFKRWYDVDPTVSRAIATNLKTLILTLKCLWMTNITTLCAAGMIKMLRFHTRWNTLKKLRMRLENSLLWKLLIF